MSTELKFYSTRDGVNLTPHYIKSETDVGYMHFMTTSGTKCFIGAYHEVGATTKEYFIWGTTGEVTETHIDQGGNDVTNQLKTILGMNNLPYSPMPIATSFSEWNTEVHLGTATPNITLTAPTDLTKSNEVRFIWVADTANATFTPPSGFKIADSNGYSEMSVGDALIYTDLTSGSLYEVSISLVASDRLSLVIIERSGVYDD